MEMVSKYKKRCSISLIMREMLQIHDDKQQQTQKTSVENLEKVELERCWWLREMLQLL